MNGENQENQFTLEAGLKQLGSDWFLWWAEGDRVFVCAKRKGLDFELQQTGKRPAEAVNKVLQAMEKEKAELVDRYNQSQKS